MCGCYHLKKILIYQVDYKIYGGLENAYTDYHKMLENEDADIVNILVESGKHAEVFKDIIKYKKHMIVEKPMALTLPDADDMNQR